MRTLKRVEIGQINVFEKLSAKEMGMIVGGYSSNPGDCFWNCMEYCSRKYNDKGDKHKFDYYGKSFERGNEAWDGTGTTDHGVGYGPNIGSRNWDGTYNLDNTPYDYLASQFKTEGSEWTKGSDMSKYFGSNYDKNSVIIGTFDTKGLLIQGSENEAHCAIFTKYNSETGDYTYIDPDNPYPPRTINEKWVIGAAKVTGKKQ